MGFGCCNSPDSRIDTAEKCVENGTREGQTETWTITLTKGEEEGKKTLGMEITPEDTVLLVKTIHQGGLTAEFNSSNPKEAVQAGDFFVVVNDQYGDADLMLTTAKQAREVTFKVVRLTPPEFCATVYKTEDTLGLKFSLNRKNMIVKEVLGGAIADWNELNKDSKISPGDMFLEVDGNAPRKPDVSTGESWGKDHMVDALKKMGEHKIKVRPIGIHIPKKKLQTEG